MHKPFTAKEPPLLAAPENRQDTPSSFILDIRLNENSDTTPLLNLTDDGCGASCPSSCTTSATD